jgi:hypothetical protein
MRRLLPALMGILGSCGGPVLQNAPRPDPGVVAGIAAAVAAAATIADPAAAGKRPESPRVNQSEAAPGHRETVPPEVLDRLDAMDRPSDAGP